jgi:ligand-binding sensor domain-containing protein
MSSLFRQYISQIGGLALLLLAVALPGRPQAQEMRHPDPEKRLSQFLLKNWTTADGLSSTNLIDIQQTRDGYLWMASYDGLIQFDGVNFHTYSKKEVPKLKNNATLSLVQALDGTLWIGTQGSGLMSYKDGQFRFVESSLLMKNMMLDGSRLWIGTQDQGVHVYDLQQQAFSEVSYPALQDITVNAVTRDKTGRIWFATELRGLVAQFNGEFSVFTESEEHVAIQTCNDVVVDPDGMLWVGTNNGMFYYENGQFHQYPDLKGYSVRKILIDKAHQMWVATGGGLFRRTERFGLELLPIDGDESTLDVQDIAIDSEGSLWFTTYRNGLYHLRDGKFENYTYRDGLASKAVGSVCQFDGERYLVGSINGKLNVVEKGKVWELKTRFELPKDRIYHLMRDSKKNIWIGTYQGLYVIRANGDELHFDTGKGLHGNLIRHIFEDGEGRVWVGTRSSGMAHFDLETGKVVQVLTANEGLGSNFILSIKQRRNGDLLVGTVNGGLSVLRDGKVQRVYKAADGLPSDLVFSTYEDEAGVLWLCTNAGIARMEGERIVAYTAAQGLPDDSIFDFLEDSEGRVWLPSNSGIVGISKQELNAFAQDSTKRLFWKLYDEGDGMYNEQCAGATHSLKGADGSIWIPTFGGLVKIDPKKIQPNHFKLPVHINSITVDGEPVDPYQSGIVIPPGAHRMIFGFSGLSLLAPDKVRFRYQMTGYDEGWLDETSERRAIYTNLPPGQHTFRVIACNNDGVWNDTGDQVTFTIEPFFTQTIWFYLLVVVVGAAVIGLISHWRTQRVKRRNAELALQIEMRTQELSRRNEEITEKTAQLSAALNKMTDSVRYAKRIQQAILGNPDQIAGNFKDAFILLMPRDIVSGDFFWYAKKFGKKVVIAADCTGHGVPGAFMTVMGNDVLNEVVSHHGITEPGSILNELDRSISETLHRQELQEAPAVPAAEEAPEEAPGAEEDAESEEAPSSPAPAATPSRQHQVNDGMDIAVLTLNEEDWEFSFAGAKNPLYIVRQGKLMEIKGSSFPIGGRKMRQPKEFKNHKYKMERGDTFYLFSDGFQDQFGGKFNRKFMKKRFRELLQSISHHPMAEQRRILVETFEKWKGDNRQTDDILVIGIRV